VNKVAFYQHKLRELSDWELFLLGESGLPGPRGNLELAQAVALEGNLEQFNYLLNFSPELAPVNDPHEFLVFCGVLGLGFLAADGQLELVEQLRPYASDPRWRVREAVAMGLQRIGDKNSSLLVEISRFWAQGSLLEQRAVVAGLAEPRLLVDKTLLAQALELFDRITAKLGDEQYRHSDGFRVLRQGLGYAWSVLVAADPKMGLPWFERWLRSPDPDIQWIMRENMKKSRLRRVYEGTHT
jgi:hypothetical protein